MEKAGKHPHRLHIKTLTVNSDVDAAGLDCPDGCRDEEADLAGELSVLVLFDHLVLQRALDGVEASGVPCHQNQQVYTCSPYRWKPQTRLKPRKGPTSRAFNFHTV